MNVSNADTNVKNRNNFDKITENMSNIRMNEAIKFMKTILVHHSATYISDDKSIEIHDFLSLKRLLFTHRWGTLNRMLRDKKEKLFVLHSSTIKFSNTETKKLVNQPNHIVYKYNNKKRNCLILTIINTTNVPQYVTSQLVR